MGKNSPLKRVDPSLIDIYNIWKKQGKVKSFPEFTRITARRLKTKPKKEFNFFK